MLKTGDRIPAFEVRDQNGNTVTDKDFEGRKVVLYFYPKDNTPGCTAEACNLRDNFSDLRAAGYEIYGVSKDSEASHARFIDKYSLFHGNVEGVRSLGRKEDVRQGDLWHNTQDIHHRRGRHDRKDYRESGHKKPYGADIAVISATFEQELSWIRRNSCAKP